MTGAAWGRGSTRQWRLTRELVLARDRRRCRIRLPGEWRNSRGRLVRCLVRADCVHHTRGKRHGDDPRFLVAACTPCNLKVGEPTTDQAADPPHRPMTQW